MWCWAFAVTMLGCSICVAFHDALKVKARIAYLKTKKSISVISETFLKRINNKGGALWLDRFCKSITKEWKS